MTPEENKRSARIGIFRRAVVERYSQPLVGDTPEMLSPRVPGLLCLALALALLAALLLGLL